MHWFLNRNQSQKQNVFWTFQSHVIHLLALLGPFKTQMTDFPTLNNIITAVLKLVKSQPFLIHVSKA